jgi:hypothetical protein
MNTFTFGKYKGSKVDDIIWFDPLYVQWCVDNVKWFELNDSQQKDLKHYLNVIKKYIPKSDPYCIEGNNKWNGTLNYMGEPNC